jgi:hypothetical protein
MRFEHGSNHFLYIFVIITVEGSIKILKKPLDCLSEAVLIDLPKVTTIFILFNVFFIFFTISFVQ